MTHHSEPTRLPRASRRLQVTPTLWVRPCTWRDRPALIGLTTSGRIALVSDGFRDERDYGAPAAADPSVAGTELMLRLARSQVVAFASEGAATEVRDLIVAAEAEQRESPRTAATDSAGVPGPADMFRQAEPWTAYSVGGILIMAAAWIIAVLSATHTDEAGAADPSAGGLILSSLMWTVGLVLLLIGVVAFASNLGTYRQREMLEELLRRVPPPDDSTAAAQPSSGRAR